MKDISDFQKKIVAFRDARDWKQFHNPKDLAVSMVLEAAEFLEHFQWKTPDEIKSHLGKNRGDVSDELVDVFYWVMLIAHDLDIDLPKAFEKKMKENENRYPVPKARGNHKKYTVL